MKRTGIQISTVHQNRGAPLAPNPKHRSPEITNAEYTQNSLYQCGTSRYSSHTGQRKGDPASTYLISNSDPQRGHLGSRTPVTVFTLLFPINPDLRTIGKCHMMHRLQGRVAIFSGVAII